MFVRLVRYGFASFIASAVVAFAWSTPASATFQIVYTASGVQPDVGAFAKDTLYLVDANGGSGNGALYTLHAGVLNVLYTFTGGADGATPNRRLQVRDDGHVVGTTRGGGTGGAGTVFDVAPNGRLKPLHDFVASTDGSVPQDGVAADRTGDFFGTTSMGAVSPGNGTIFQVVHGRFGVTYAFQSQNDGHCPFTGLQRDVHGDLFGTTVGLGFGGQPMGSVWEYTTQGTLVTLYAFTNGNDGEWPMITPTIDSIDDVWGVSTIQNGNAYAGAVWTITTAGFGIRHQFTGGSDGWQPNGPLLLARDGSLYGTTIGGGSASGSSGYGVVYRISRTGVFGVVHTFQNGADGAYPTGGLAQDRHGHVYGGTQSGTIFEITP